MVIARLCCECPAKSGYNQGLHSAQNNDFIGQPWTLRIIRKKHTKKGACDGQYI